MQAPGRGVQGGPRRVGEPARRVPVRGRHRRTCSSCRGTRVEGPPVSDCARTCSVPLNAPGCATCPLRSVVAGVSDLCCGSQRPDPSLVVAAAAGAPASADTSTDGRRTTRVATTQRIARRRGELSPFPPFIPPLRGVLWKTVFLRGVWRIVARAPRGPVSRSSSWQHHLRAACLMREVPLLAQVSGAVRPPDVESRRQKVEYRALTKGYQVCAMMS